MRIYKTDGQLFLGLLDYKYNLYSLFDLLYKYFCRLSYFSIYKYKCQFIFDKDYKIECKLIRDYVRFNKTKFLFAQKLEYKTITTYKPAQKFAPTFASVIS